MSGTVSCSKSVLRRCALGLGKRCMHRLGQSEAMHLKAVHIQVRHAGKSPHLRGVALDACLRSLARGAVFVPCGAAGQHQRSGHALQIPLERAANGFIEVVDVEDEAAVGRGIGAQVAHVRIAAELAHDAGRGQLGQVRSHHRRRAAKVSERRLGHQLRISDRIECQARALAWTARRSPEQRPAAL